MKAKWKQGVWIRIRIRIRISPDQTLRRQKTPEPFWRSRCHRSGLHPPLPSPFPQTEYHSRSAVPGCVSVWRGCGSCRPDRVGICDRAVASTLRSRRSRTSRTRTLSHRCLCLCRCRCADPGSRPHQWVRDRISGGGFGSASVETVLVADDASSAVWELHDLWAHQWRQNSPQSNWFQYKYQHWLSPWFIPLSDEFLNTSMIISSYQCIHAGFV